MGRREHTKLFAHLPYTHGCLGQLSSQASAEFFIFVVVVSSPVHTQLMGPFLFRRSFLQTLRLEPVRQRSTVIKMRMDKTRRSCRLLHAWWEM